MILVAAVLAALGAILLLVLDAGLLLAALAFIVLVAVPGWAIADLALPDAATDPPARLGLAVGVGLAVAIIVGVVVGLIGLPMGLVPLVLLALAIGAVVTGAMTGRRAFSTWDPRRVAGRLATPRVERTGRERLLGASGAGERVARSGRGGLAAGFLATPGRDAVLLALAGLIAIGAFGLARTGVDDPAPAQLAQLWAVRAADGPLEIGVRNIGSDPDSYEVTVEAGGTVVDAWWDIALPPDGTWEMSVPDAAPGSAETVVTLRRAGEAAPYRRVVLAPPDIDG